MLDTHYKLLKILSERPDISQRELARELGVSLGKTNYCLQALVEKGWVKARNFSTSTNKRGYLYLLTPAGVEQKARLAVDFLRRKMCEHEALQQEIRELRREIESNAAEMKLKT